MLAHPDGRAKSTRLKKAMVHYGNESKKKANVWYALNPKTGKFQECKEQ